MDGLSNGIDDLPKSDHVMDHEDSMDTDYQDYDYRLGCSPLSENFVPSSDGEDLEDEDIHHIFSDNDQADSGHEDPDDSLEIVGTSAPTHSPSPPPSPPSPIAPKAPRRIHALSSSDDDDDDNIPLSCLADDRPPSDDERVQVYDIDNLDKEEIDLVHDDDNAVEIVEAKNLIPDDCQNESQNLKTDDPKTVKKNKPKASKKDKPKAIKKDKPKIPKKDKTGAVEGEDAKPKPAKKKKKKPKPDDKTEPSQAGEGEELKKKKKKRKSKKRKAEEGIEDEDEEAKKKTKTAFERRNIRKIFTDDKVDSVTLNAQKEEMERMQRLKELREKLAAQQHELEMQEKERLERIAHSELKSLLEAEGEDDDDEMMGLLQPEEFIQPKDETMDRIDKKPSDDISKSHEDKAKVEQKQKDESDDDVIELSSDEDDIVMLPSDHEDEEEEDDDDDPNNSGCHANDALNQPDMYQRVLVNSGHPVEEKDIFLAPQLARQVKPHQIGGIRFLFDNLVESAERYEKCQGFGCILAHSMGLGKTIQVISFVETFLRHTSAKTVLVIVPVNTLQNWLAEFNKWLPPENPPEKPAPPKTPAKSKSKSRSRSKKNASENSSKSANGKSGKSADNGTNKTADGGCSASNGNDAMANGISCTGGDGSNKTGDSQPSNTQDSSNTSGDATATKNADSSSEKPMDVSTTRMNSGIGSFGYDSTEDTFGNNSQGGMSNASSGCYGNYFGPGNNCNNIPGSCTGSTFDSSFGQNTFPNYGPGTTQNCSTGVMFNKDSSQNNFGNNPGQCPMDNSAPCTMGYNPAAGTNSFGNYSSASMLGNNPGIGPPGFNSSLNMTGGHSFGNMPANNCEDTFGNVPGPNMMSNSGMGTYGYNSTPGPTGNYPCSNSVDFNSQPNTTNCQGGFNSWPTGYDSRPNLSGMNCVSTTTAACSSMPITSGVNSAPGMLGCHSGPNYTFSNSAGISTTTSYSGSGPYGCHPTATPYGNSQNAPGISSGQLTQSDGTSTNEQSGTYSMNASMSGPMPSTPVVPQTSRGTEETARGDSWPVGMVTSADDTNTASKDSCSGSAADGSDKENQSTSSSKEVTGKVDSMDRASIKGTESEKAEKDAKEKGVIDKSPSQDSSENPAGDSKADSTSSAPGGSADNTSAEGTATINSCEAAVDENSSASKSADGATDSLKAFQDATEALEKLAADVWPRTFPLHILNDSHRTASSRAKIVDEWQNKGGVLLMGYEMYRLMTSKRAMTAKAKRSRKPAPAEDMVIDVEEEDRNKELLGDIHGALINPGPDLVVCDEGHRIKNSHASISQALKKIRTKRRVVLTGYPLQNNLIEYWCMVDFVRPNFLGTRQEFSNMFERPIMNGQCMDSTPKDLKLMRFRAHVLHSLLEGFVQRRGHSVLKMALPPKEEYVLLVRMSPIQRKLYNMFMEVVADPSVETWANSNPIKAFSVCCKIWNHPDILYELTTHRKTDDFDLDLDPENETGKAKKKSKAAEARAAAKQQAAEDGINTPSDKKEPVITYEWADELMKDYIPGLKEHGGKMLILLSLLEESVREGDKILVFSQSLFTLNLIEDYLGRQKIPVEGCEENWARNKSYFRLDGSTSGSEREKLIREFNDPKNTQLHLFLLSTRAGCLGINLIGANRVVIFDASWNPCHDCQAVCRVYRYGQMKPSFVYRLVTDNTMERKIYDRQINKQGISDRVVDEAEVQNNFSSKQVDVLMDYEDRDMPTIDPECGKDCSDPVLRTVLEKNHKWITKEPFTHESLLIDRKDKKLTKKEKRLAKESYEMEKKMNISYSRPSYAAYYPKNMGPMNMNHRPMLPNSRYSTTISMVGGRPVASIRPMISTPIPMQARGVGSSQVRPATGALPVNSLLKPGVSVHQVQTTTDIMIPGSATATNSQGSKIPAGENVMVIKTPKGVYIRTNQGKIFAVRSGPTKPSAAGSAASAGVGNLDNIARTTSAATVTVVNSANSPIMSNVRSMSGGSVQFQKQQNSSGIIVVSRLPPKPGEAPKPQNIKVVTPTGLLQKQAAAAHGPNAMRPIVSDLGGGKKLVKFVVGSGIKAPIQIKPGASTSVLKPTSISVGSGKGNPVTKLSAGVDKRVPQPQGDNTGSKEPEDKADDPVLSRSVTSSLSDSGSDLETLTSKKGTSHPLESKPDRSDVNSSCTNLSSMDTDQPKEKEVDSEESQPHVGSESRGDSPTLPSLESMALDSSSTSLSLGDDLVMPTLEPSGCIPSPRHSSAPSPETSDGAIVQCSDTMGNQSLDTPSIQPSKVSSIPQAGATSVQNSKAPSIPVSKVPNKPHSKAPNVPHSEAPGLKLSKLPPLSPPKPPHLVHSETPNVQHSEPPRLSHSETPSMLQSEPPRLSHPEAPNVQHCEPPHISHSEAPKLQHSEPPTLSHMDMPSLSRLDPPSLSHQSTSGLRVNALDRVPQHSSIPSQQHGGIATPQPSKRISKASKTKKPSKSRIVEGAAAASHKSPSAHKVNPAHKLTGSSLKKPVRQFQNNEMPVDNTASSMNNSWMDQLGGESQVSDFGFSMPENMGMPHQEHPVSNVKPPENSQTRPQPAAMMHKDAHMGPNHIQDSSGSESPEVSIVEEKSNLVSRGGAMSYQGMGHYPGAYTGNPFMPPGLEGNQGHSSMHPSYHHPGYSLPAHQMSPWYPNMMWNHGMMPMSQYGDGRGGQRYGESGSQYPRQSSKSRGAASVGQEKLRMPETTENSHNSNSQSSQDSNPQFNDFRDVSGMDSQFEGYHGDWQDRDRTRGHSSPNPTSTSYSMGAPPAHHGVPPNMYGGYPYPAYSPYMPQHMYPMPPSHSGQQHYMPYQHYPAAMNLSSGGMMPSNHHSHPGGVPIPASPPVHHSTGDGRRRETEQPTS